jgi:hypothetical protein
LNEPHVIDMFTRMPHDLGSEIYRLGPLLMTSIAFVTVGSVCLALFLFAPFAKTTIWRATITPLASIIGSGFLVSAPLLAREFGGYAAPAMALLIVFAGCIGWAIRYNIRVVEGLLKENTDRKLVSVEKLSHVVLAFAYFVSAAYYLSLLGHFVLQTSGIQSDATAKGIAISLLVVIGALGWTGGAKKVAKIEGFATALNLSVIVGFLVALAVYSGGLISQGQSVLPPPGKFELSSLPVLLGLLIVVQGFETTRFTGDDFDADTRQRAMWIAQLVSGIIYVSFFVLLSPLLNDLATGTGVAAIITVSATVAMMLPFSLTVSAVASQFSASIADSMGNAGLIEQITGNRVDPRHAYPLIAFVGIGIIVSLDVNGVIALASRAFALFYALQCLVAWEAARHRQVDQRKASAFMGLAVLSGAVFIFGVPAG